MMKLNKNFHSTLIAVFSLAFYIFSFAGFGNAGVLCFGDDGHISIEMKETMSPSSLPVKVTDHHFDNTERDDHCEDHCSSCVDFPLSTTTACQNVHVKKYDFTPAENPLSSIVGSIDVSSFSDCSPPIEEPSIVSSAVIAQRTVVLLI
jgi:hypothetical protein